MKITEHFDSAEVLIGTSLRTIPLSVIDNVTRTAMAMEGVRSMLGDRPVTVTSWYRPPDVNKRVGGSPTSAHPAGLAVDFKVKGLSPHEVVRALAPHAASLGLDQVIEYSTHVHIGLGAKNRGELLTANTDSTFKPWSSSEVAPVKGREPGAAPTPWSFLWWLALAIGILTALREIVTQINAGG